MKRNHDLVDVDGEFRMQKGDGIAIYTGVDDDNGREVWVWLPVSQVENNRDGTFTMPEWLAVEKGLV